MKTSTLSRRFTLLIAISILALSQFGCKKDTPSPTIYPIQGLWEGTYTVASGLTYYLSFSIYPDGTLSYKGKAYYYNTPYTAFADGTWTLEGTKFSFSVTTINYPEKVQHKQFGTAIFNSLEGTLTEGKVYDSTSASGDPASWKMTKVK